MKIDISFVPFFLIFFTPTSFVWSQTNIQFDDLNIELEEIVAFKKEFDLCQINKRNPNQIKEFYEAYFCNSRIEIYNSLYEDDRRVVLEDSVFIKWKEYIKNVKHVSEGYIVFEYDGKQYAGLTYISINNGFQTRNVKFAYNEDGNWYAPDSKLNLELSSLKKFLITISLSDLELLNNIAKGNTRSTLGQDFVQSTTILGNKVNSAERSSVINRRSSGIKLNSMVERTEESMKEFDKLYRGKINIWLSGYDLPQIIQSNIVELIRSGLYLRAANEIIKYVDVEGDNSYDYTQQIKSICNEKD